MHDNVHLFVSIVITSRNGYSVGRDEDDIFLNGREFDTRDCGFIDDPSPRSIL